jgi:siroheme synthase
VARLKGGCPSVFSRVSSELTALAAAGIDVELVPGISSALAAPLLAGAALIRHDPHATLHHKYSLCIICMAFWAYNVVIAEAI